MMLSPWSTLVKSDCLGVLGVSGHLLSLPCEIEGFANHWPTPVLTHSRHNCELGVVVTALSSSFVP